MNILRMGEIYVNNKKTNYLCDPIDTNEDYLKLQKKAANLEKRIRNKLDDTTEFDELMNITIELQGICLKSKH